MTMLDRMRRHKGWLKWSLALVVLTFIVFYIPDFLGQNATTTVGAAPREVIAEVDGRDLTAGDFPGADMARKFLQMGWTRARRYANHKGGRKYDKETGGELPRTVDPEKAAAAAVFYERYVAARQHPDYLRQKQLHRENYEGK